MKTACVVNRPSPKEKSEALRFHGVTDGPLFRAAAKKNTQALELEVTLYASVVHW